MFNDGREYDSLNDEQEDFVNEATQFIESFILNGAVLDGVINYTPPVVLKTRKEPAKKAKYADDTKFSFYGCVGDCNNHKGVIVIASCLHEEAGIVYYGASYCSPKDVYNKETGKSIAYSNMVRDAYCVALGKKKHHEINARIFSDIVANDDAPSWAKDAVALELASHLVRAFDMTTEAL